MEVLLQQIINGLVLEQLYALVALHTAWSTASSGYDPTCPTATCSWSNLTSWTIIGVMRTRRWHAWLARAAAGGDHCHGGDAAITRSRLAYRPLRSSSRLAP
jgi:hypothetical protein